MPISGGRRRTLPPDVDRSSANIRFGFLCSAVVARPSRRGQRDDLTEPGRLPAIPRLSAWPSARSRLPALLAGRSCSPSHRRLVRPGRADKPGISSAAVGQQPTSALHPGSATSEVHDGRVPVPAGTSRQARGRLERRCPVPAFSMYVSRARLITATRALGTGVLMTALVRRDRHQRPLDDRHPGTGCSRTHADLVRRRSFRVRFAS